MAHFDFGVDFGEGPDPASIDSATVGGVVANNAGGMRCRPERDAYHTTRAMTPVLASGTT